MAEVGFPAGSGGLVNGVARVFTLPVARVAEPRVMVVAMRFWRPEQFARDSPDVLPGPVVVGQPQVLLTQFTRATAWRNLQNYGMPYMEAVPGLPIMAAALLLLLRLTRQRFHLWFGINMAIGALAVGTRVAAYHFGWDFRSMLAADILWDFLGGATLALFLAGYLELRSAAGLAGDSGAWAGEGGPNAVAVSPSRAEGGRDLFRVWDRGRHAAWAVGVPGLAGTSTPFTSMAGQGSLSTNF